MVILLLVFALLGGGPIALLQQLPPDQQAPQSYEQASEPPGNNETRQFVATVLADTEEVWGDLFAHSGSQYKPPRLVLFTGATEMPGGVATTATGPFYLPANQTVYLDLGFFDERKQRFGFHGYFAAAYIIAHEVGLHVQHLLGLTEHVHSQRGRVSEAEYNELSVRLELQADFLAGVWAHHDQSRWNILEEGDIHETLDAAAIVGDDHLQKATTGRVVPDAFTHGTSAQRKHWFMKGFESGNMSAGNTFTIPLLPTLSYA